MKKERSNIVVDRRTAAERADQLMAELMNPIAMAGRFQGTWNHGDPCTMCS